MTQAGVEEVEDLEAALFHGRSMLQTRVYDWKSWRVFHQACVELHNIGIRGPFFRGHDVHLDLNTAVEQEEWMTTKEYIR